MYLMDNDDGDDNNFDFFSAPLCSASPFHRVFVIQRKKNWLEVKSVKGKKSRIKFTVNVVLKVPFMGGKV